jgi:putative aldouronate transport system substrate-binding protein
MGKTWRVATAGLALALLAAGCQETGEKAGPQADAGGSPTASAKVEEKGTAGGAGFKKFDPPVTFTQNKINTEGTVYQPGDSLENNGYTRWLQNDLGIIVKPKWITPNLETDVQKLNIGAASGALPDVIGAEAPVLGNLAQQGVLMPLNDLIEKHGSPLLKHVIELAQKDAKGKLFSPFTIDGKIYAFPKMIDRMAYWSTNWIRKDLLEELGKPVPTTLSEMEEVLAAYKSKYPGGTGMVLDKDMQGIDLLTQAFDAQPKKWRLDGDGKVVYGSIQPQMKEALVKLHDWYAKGYINREFIAKNNDNTISDLTSGNTLTWTNGQWWNVYFPFPDMWKNVPKANMAAMPTLKGENGKRSVIIDTVSNYGVAINKSYKQPEVIIALYNMQLDSLYRSNEAIRKELAGKYEFKYPVTALQTPLNPTEKNASLFKYSYGQPGWGWFNDFPDNDANAWGFQGRLGSEAVNRLERIAAALQKGSKDGLNASEANDYDGLSAEPQRPNAFQSVLSTWLEREKGSYVSANVYPGVPTPAMTQKKAYLDKLEAETFARIIMGQEPAAAFDKFVDSWKKGGGDDITKEINAWYQANK